MHYFTVKTFIYEPLNSLEIGLCNLCPPRFSYLLKITVVHCIVLIYAFIIIGRLLDYKYLII